jgi:hypothetical protein
MKLEIENGGIHSNFSGFARADMVRFQGASYSASFSLNIQVDTPTEVVFSAHLSAGGSSEGHAVFRFYLFESLYYVAASSRGDSDVSTALLFNPGEPWRLEFDGSGAANGGQFGVALSTAASSADIVFIIPEPSSLVLFTFVALLGLIGQRDLRWRAFHNPQD